MSISRATIRGTGASVAYRDDVLGEGGMKRVHLTEDNRQVVAFFKDRQDAGLQRLTRLEKVLGQYNPTSCPTHGDYWKSVYCWPTALVDCSKRGLGILLPKYPADFFFKDGPWSGKEKQAGWFFGQTAGGKPFRELLPASEQGDFQQFLFISLRLARAVRRLHAAGLAHSDLSARNVLIDPPNGQCIIIDLDSLVVPGFFAPDVIGTAVYVAPEVLATLHLQLNDANRKHPCAATDQYALAVLIYQYLLKRHPLRGPKVHSAMPEEDEHLAMCPKALWIEHPTDASNHPRDLKVPSARLGKLLHGLFERAFVQGLLNPMARPAAMEWERALIRTNDLLYPCPSNRCENRWTVVDPDKPRTACIWCGSQVVNPFPVLTILSQRRTGVWFPDAKLVIRHNHSLFKWHAYDNVFPNEGVDKTPVGYCALHRGKWLFVNQDLDALRSPSGKPVPKGSAIELSDGAEFQFTLDDHGRKVVVEMHNR